ncbi:ankyrin repeat and SOCS box protein 2-like [Mytilus edulis]|uniref:ankyrin repeat and SOCS box protein 2-like n=1 Tax=Mytilus edulis TaxID=6550 RepID=UPI0039EE9323
MAFSLIDAVRCGDKETAKKILMNKKYTAIDIQGSKNDGTALFWACCRGFFDILHILVIQGASLNSKTAWGATPIHAACDNNQPEIVRLLIKYGCDLNEKTESGDTPLHLACYRGFPEIVQILIEAGANFNIFNSKHQIPSDIAYVQGYYTIVNYLQAVKQIVKNSSSKAKHRRLSDHNCVTCCLSQDPNVPREVYEYWTRNDLGLQNCSGKENNLSNQQNKSTHHRNV